MDKFLGERLSSNSDNSNNNLDKSEFFINEKLDKYVKDHFISYDLSENKDRKSIDFNVKFKDEINIFSIEELYGMLFRYLKFITEKYINSKIYEVYVSVPSSWGYKKRHALKQAISLSNLTVKGMITQNTAAATQFISDKSFNSTVNYIFYDMGSTYTQVSLVSFVNKQTTDNYNKTVEYKEANIMAEAWDEHLGGRDFDFKLVNLLMDKHYGSKNEKKTYNVAEKILPSVIKYKEILSSNKQVAANILGIESGVNLVSSVTKDEFEEYSKDLFDRVYKPIEKVLLMSNMTVDDIEQVEIIGGGVRVPKIQDILKEKLGESKLGAHMNGDDSFALGTAYISANSTKYFRVKKRVIINNGAPYELKLKILPLLENSQIDKENESIKNEAQICTEDIGDSFAEDCVRDINKNTTIYKIRHGYDVSRSVSFKHDSNLLLIISQKMEGYDNEEEVIRYKVTGFKEAINEFKSNNITNIPKINLRFKLNESGLLSMTGDIIYESILYYTRYINNNNNQENQENTNTSSDINTNNKNISYEYKYSPLFTEQLNEEELAVELDILKSLGKNETDAEYQKIKNIGKSKKEENKINLKVEKVINTYPLPMNKEQLAESKKKLDSLDKYEEDKLRNIEARNTLETDIYAKKEWVEGENAKLYSKSEDLEAIENKLKEVYDWYEEDGWNADTQTLKNKHSEFKDMIVPIETRRQKHERRIKATDDLLDHMHKYNNDNINKLFETKPWIETHYNEVFKIEYDRMNEWIEEKKIEHAKLKLYEDPIVSGETYELKLRQIKREYNKLISIPKPKEEVNNFNNSTNTEENSKEKSQNEDLNSEDNKEGAKNNDTNSNENNNNNKNQEDL